MEIKVVLLLSAYRGGEQHVAIKNVFTDRTCLFLIDSQISWPQFSQNVSFHHYYFPYDLIPRFLLSQRVTHVLISDK